MADLRTGRDDGVDIATALNALPLESPERSAWPVLAARLAEQQRQVRRRSRWPYAAAAAALLALALLPRGGALTGDGAPVAHVPSSPTNLQVSGTRLAALMRQSAQLERLVAAANDDGASSGSTTALSLQMEDSLQRLDASLNNSALTGPQQLALWQQRVNLLQQMASLETSRHYYAAEGRGFDIALVSAY